MMDAGWAVAAFGDPDQAVWGVLIGGPSPRLAVGGQGEGDPAFETAEIERATDNDWIVRSSRASLRLSGPEPAAPNELVLCELSGELDADGARRPVTARGVRCAELPSRKIGSVRFVASWFAAGHGVGLLAARPERAGGQDRDELAVVVYGEADRLNVFDARLSTTYGAGPAPQRMGIELWLGETEDGDQYPRRVAGTSAGPPAAEVLGRVRIAAFPMDCHSRGDDGVGVYVLVTPA